MEVKELANDDSVVNFFKNFVSEDLGTWLSKSQY